MLISESPVKAHRVTWGRLRVETDNSSGWGGSDQLTNSLLSFSPFSYLSIRLVDGKRYWECDFSKGGAGRSRYQQLYKLTLLPSIVACANNVVPGSYTATFIGVFFLWRHFDRDVRTLQCAYPCWLLLLLLLLSFFLSFFFPFFLSFFFPFFFLLSLHQKYSNIFSLIYSAGNRTCDFFGAPLFQATKQHLNNS